MTALPRPTSPNGSTGLARAVVPSAVLGALIFVAVEVMFFSGILSALTISRAGAAPGTWPPPGQPALSPLAGDASVAVVLASGALLVAAHRRRAASARAARHLILGAAALGGAFVLLQAEHAIRLFGAGFSLASSQHASFVCLLSGLHALHAIVTLGALLVAWRRLGRGDLSPGTFGAVQVLWYFVVLMWPVLYARVYV